MKIFHILALLLLTTVLPLVADPGLAPQAGDTIPGILRRQTGQKVELRLNSGQNIAGKVESVGDSTVYLTNLVGMELYEAVVSLDDISAIVARAPAK